VKEITSCPKDYNRLLSKLAAGSAGEGASARRKDVILDECLWTTQLFGRPLDRLPLGSPKGVSLAGVGEWLLDAASTEATLSCSSTVEFPKKPTANSFDENRPFTLHPSPFTRHPSPFTLHPSPFTLHPSLLLIMRSGSRVFKVIYF
jgi:hypothetical protein